MARLEEIKARCEVATEGPWKHELVGLVDSITDTLLPYEAR